MDRSKLAAEGGHHSRGVKGEAMLFGMFRHRGVQPSLQAPFVDFEVRATKILKSEATQQPRHSREGGNPVGSDSWLRCLLQIGWAIIKEQDCKTRLPTGFPPPRE